MRVMVTGGAGFIGSNLVRHLVGAGHEVLNFDKLTYAGNLASLADLVGNPRHHFVRADIADAAASRAAFRDFRPDWVLHLAAESHVDRSIDDPGGFILTNVQGTFTLLQEARRYWDGLPEEAKRRVRFLHVSTDEVYGSLGSSGQFSETSRYDPHSPYSASKAASDHLVRAWHDTYGLPTLVTNGSNNYGPYQFPEKLIPVVIMKGLGGEPIPVYGQGHNVRDWLYVQDHVEALVAVAERGQPGETYNIGGDNEWRNLDLVRRLCGLLDELRPHSHGRAHAEQITLVTDRPGHDLRYAIDASKLRRELGWVPRRSHDSGFRLTVQWYLENEAWWKHILSGDYRLERMGIGKLGAGIAMGGPSHGPCTGSPGRRV